MISSTSSWLSFPPPPVPPGPVTGFGVRNSRSGRSLIVARYAVSSAGMASAILAFRVLTAASHSSWAALTNLLQNSGVAGSGYPLAA